MQVLKVEVVMWVTKKKEFTRNIKKTVFYNQSQQTHKLKMADSFQPSLDVLHGCHGNCQPQLDAVPLLYTSSLQICEVALTGCCGCLAERSEPQEGEHIQPLVEPGNTDRHMLETRLHRDENFPHGHTNRWLRGNEATVGLSQLDSWEIYLRGDLILVNNRGKLRKYSYDHSDHSMKIASGFLCQLIFVVPWLTESCCPHVSPISPKRRPSRKGSLFWCCPLSCPASITRLMKHIPAD